MSGKSLSNIRTFQGWCTSPEQTFSPLAGGCCVAAHCIPSSSSSRRACAGSSFITAKEPTTNQWSAAAARPYVNSCDRSLRAARLSLVNAERRALVNIGQQRFENRQLKTQLSVFESKLWSLGLLNSHRRGGRGIWSHRHDGCRGRCGIWDCRKRRQHGL